MWNALSRPKQLWLSAGTTVTFFATAYMCCGSNADNDEKDKSATPSVTVYQQSIGQANWFAPIRSVCEPLLMQHQGSCLRRHQTIQQMEKTATKESLIEMQPQVCPGRNQSSFFPCSMSLEMEIGRAHV